MTMAPPVRPEAVPPVALPSVGTGERQRRRQAKRRSGRQQLLVVLLMMLALIITVAVLAQQWLATSAPGAGNEGLRQAGAGILSVVTR